MPQDDPPKPTEKTEDKAEGSGKQEETFEEVEGRQLALGKVTVGTFKDLITQFDATVNLSVINVPRQVGVVIPGIVSGEHKIKGAEALWAIGRQKGIPETDVNQIVFLAQCFQSFITFSTSPNVSNSSNRKTTGKYGGLTVSVSHDEIKTALDNELIRYGYENTPRQWARSFSSAIIQGLVSGKLAPNIKICAKHGIPPNYYAFSPDCIIVDSRLHGMDAMIASEMGRMIAIRNAGGSGKTIHNVYETTAIAPEVFLASGGRR